MQLFERQALRCHCIGARWPDFLGRVQLGESFIIETESCNPNGPIEIAGVKAGDDLAIHIEKIEVAGPFKAPNGGPFFEGCGPDVTLEYREGYFYWPNHFRLKASPSVGNVAVLPEPTAEVMEAIREYNYGGKRWRNAKGWRRVVREPRDKHCHQDCYAVTAGSIVHMKAQVDGAGLCMDDVHAYIGQGEMSFAGIEVCAGVQVRVERSPGWKVDWPIIETAEEIMVFSSYTTTYVHRPALEYVDVIREAYRALREVVAAKVGCSIAEANSIVATAVDIRNCALYGLERFISKEKSPTTCDIAVVAALPKHVFM